MVVINLIGAPGAGKSTIAAMLFAKMKIAGYKVELVTEYAKDMVYENRDNVLSDQLYILAKQNRRLSRLCGHDLDYVITDSPILLACVYNQGDLDLRPIVVRLFSKMDNLIFKINRVAKYQEYGRNVDEAKSDLISTMIDDLLLSLNCEYYNVDGDVNAADNIFSLANLKENGEL